MISLCFLTLTAPSPTFRRTLPTGAPCRTPVKGGLDTLFLNYAATRPQLALYCVAYSLGEN